MVDLEVAPGVVLRVARVAIAQRGPEDEDRRRRRARHQRRGRLADPRRTDVRKHWTLLVIGLVVVFGTFLGTLASGDTPTLGLDLQGGMSVVLSPVGDFTDNSLDVAVDIIRDRVDSLGTLEPEITRQGDDIVIDLPGVEDRAAAIELVGKTAELRFRPGARDPPARRRARAPPPRPPPTTTTGPAGETTPTTTTVPTDAGADTAAAKAAVASCDQTAVAALPEIPTTTLGRRQARTSASCSKSRDGGVALPPRPGRAHGQGRRAPPRASSRVGQGYVVNMDLNDDGQHEVQRAGGTAVRAAVADRPGRRARRHRHHPGRHRAVGTRGAGPDLRRDGRDLGWPVRLRAGEADDLAKLIDCGALPVQLKHGEHRGRVADARQRPAARRDHRRASSASRWSPSTCSSSTGCSAWW